MPHEYAVIIPHYNDVQRLRKCLAGVTARDTQDVDIVVVDNASTEPLDIVRSEFPGVRFLTESGKGAALARNRGVHETTAPHLFFIDADCVPAANWLATAKQLAGSADLIGGRIDVFDETPPPRSGAEAFETIFAFNWREYIEKKHFSVTANLVTSRKVFLDVGDFINGVSEDAEWCLRARAKGYRIVAAEELAVSHPTRRDWPALEKKWRRITREMFELGGTDGRARLKWAVRALMMPASAVAHAPKLLFSPRLASGSERLRGLGTLFRLRFLRCGWMLRQAATGRP